MVLDRTPLPRAATILPFDGTDEPTQARCGGLMRLRLLQSDPAVCPHAIQDACPLLRSIHYCIVGTLEQFSLDVSSCGLHQAPMM